MILKELPSDFKVTEITDIKLGEGKYSVFSLKKTNYTTEDAVRRICDAAGLKRKQISYAGIKDKVAVTRQFITIERVNSNRIENLNFKNISLKHLGYINRPLSLGLLKANSFEIIVRKLSRPVLASQDYLINYFDEQRFSENNHIIGKSIILQDFKSAANALSQDSKYGQKITEYLAINANDYVGAIKLIPTRIIQIYMHSYQSYLWNMLVFNILNSFDDLPSDLKLPLPGFDTPPTSQRYKKVLDAILNLEQVKSRDFILRQFPKVSLEGTLRKVFVEAEGLKAHFFDDELYENYYAVKLDFILKPGSYATCVIKQLLGFEKEFRGCELINIE